MRRLGMFVFLTGAFCPPIALLLMLVHGNMDWLTSRSDLMLLGLWGWLSCCSQRSPHWGPSAAPSVRARAAGEGCCCARCAVPVPQGPSECLSDLTRKEVQRHAFTELWSV